MDSKCKKAVVIGADGVIGRVLYEGLKSKYSVVYGTSRRSDAEQEFIHFDLFGDMNDLCRVAAQCQTAYLCVGTTNMLDCEKNPADAYALNVTKTLKLVNALQACGVFVVWLSSNVVFSGKRPFAGEDDVYSPSTEYGRQKAAAEQGIRKLGGVGIVRLTKVLCKETPLIKRWKRDLEDGREINPISDAYFSPISSKYAFHAIASVGLNAQPGIFNVSGDCDLAYSDFARMLAMEICGEDRLVNPVTRAKAKVKIFLFERYGSLEMIRLTKDFNIKAQSARQVLIDII